MARGWSFPALLSFARESTRWKGLAKKTLLAVPLILDIFRGCSTIFKTSCFILVNPLGTLYLRGELGLFLRLTILF